MNRKKKNSSKNIYDCKRFGRSYSDAQQLQTKAENDKAKTTRITLRLTNKSMINVSRFASHMHCTVSYKTPFRRFTFYSVANHKKFPKAPNARRR